MTKNDLKFFRPLWRRIVVVAICVVWGFWELSNGETFWALMSGALGLYCVWELFIRFEANTNGSKPDAKD